MARLNHKLQLSVPSGPNLRDKHPGDSLVLSQLHRLKLRLVCLDSQLKPQEHLAFSVHHKRNSLSSPPNLPCLELQLRILSSHRHSLALVVFSVNQLKCNSLVCNNHRQVCSASLLRLNH